MALIDGVIVVKLYGFSNMEYKERKWVIRDTNESIKMAGNKHLGYASIITTKCVILRDGVLASKLYGF